MSFFKVVEADLVGFFNGLGADVRLGLIGLGHLAPALTQAATVAETVTGNGALVPLTNAAGAGAAALGNQLAASGTASNAVSQAVNTAQQVVNTVETVASTTGAGSVATAVQGVGNQLSLAASALNTLDTADTTGNGQQLLTEAGGVQAA